MNNVFGLTPLLTASITIETALLFIAVMLLTMTISTGFAWLLRNYIAAPARMIVITALIAGSTSCADLMAQVFAYDQAQRLDFFLPLVASNVLLFAQLDRILNAQFDSFWMMLQDSAKLMGITAATIFIVVAIVQLISADNALPIIFIAAAALIALHNRFGKKTPPPNSTPRKRVRVTGAVR